MCARVVKNKLRTLLRNRMKQLKVPLEDPYRRLVVEYLNVVLGSSEQSEEYWERKIKPALQGSFLSALSDAEAKASYNLKSLISTFESDVMDGRLFVCRKCRCSLSLSLYTVLADYTHTC
jgi:hypothetical protein